MSENTARHGGFDEYQSDPEFERRLASASPLIRRVIGKKLGPAHDTDDAEDIYSNVVLLLLKRWQSPLAPIQDFQSYAVAVAKNCYNEYLRERYPARRR